MKRACIFKNTNKHEQTHASSLPVRQTGIRQLKINFVRMKSIKSILLLTFTATSTLLFAKKPITVSEDSIFYGNSKYPGMVVTIPEVNYEQTHKNWIRELQSCTKSDMVSENGEMSIFGAII